MAWEKIPLVFGDETREGSAQGDETWLDKIPDETTDNAESFFSSCERDDRGYCLPGEGGGEDGSAASVEDGDSTPCDPCHEPDVEDDGNGDGVTDVARVGVHAMEVPPPPPIGRLPNLTEHERAVERAFVEHYENNPDQVANDFREVIKADTKPGDPPTFGTDDAKKLNDSWSHPDQDTRANNRATLNLALHQTANAICKRAFLQELDTLSPGSEILVTVGGCGAGKGFALGKHGPPEVQGLKKNSAVVWDSAGDQNATENPWIQKEAEARGLKVTYAYVHANPETQWAHPERGVVKRAGDPNDGRMVDAKVFADSYALGARNHQAFYEKNRDNPNAKFVFLSNVGKPQLMDGIPKEALSIDRTKLADFAVGALKTADAPDRVVKGGSMGERVWPKKN